MKKFTEREVEISNQIAAFLKTHEAVSMNFIEKQLKIPQGHLSRCVKNDKTISPNHFWRLITFLANYGLKIDGFALVFEDNVLIMTKKVATFKGKTYEIVGQDGVTHYQYACREYRDIADSIFDLLGCDGF